MGNEGKYLRDVLNRIYNHESLAGVDLRNLYLSYMDLSRFDLQRANFEGCRLSCVIMDFSNLTDANFTDANLTNASFKKANLTGAILKGTIVVGADFKGVKGLPSEAKRYLRSKGARGL